MAKIKKTDNSECWQGRETSTSFIHCWGNVESYSHLGKLAFSDKVQHALYT